MHATASIRGFSPSPALTGLGFASPVRPVFSAFDSYRTFSSYSDDSRNYSNTNLLQRNDNNISNNAMYNSVKDSNNSSNYNISRENMQPLIDNTFLCPNTTAATLQPHNAFFNASLESFHPQALAGSMQLPIPDLYNSQRISYFPQLNQQHQLEHQQQRPLDSYSSAYPEARSPIFLHFGPRSPVVTHNHSHHSIEPSLPSPTSPPRSPFNEHIASTTPQQPQQPQQQYLHHFMLPGSHGGGIAKPPRFKPNENELTLLTAVFTKNPYPSSTIRKKLAEKMGLEIKQIQFWFQNRRALSKVQGNPLSKPKKGISDVSLSGYECSVGGRLEKSGYLSIGYLPLDIYAGNLSGLENEMSTKIEDARSEIPKGVLPVMLCKTSTPFDNSIISSQPESALCASLTSLTRESFPFFSPSPLFHQHRQRQQQAVAPVVSSSSNNNIVPTANASASQPTAVFSISFATLQEKLTRKSRGNNNDSSCGVNIGGEISHNQTPQYFNPHHQHNGQNYYQQLHHNPPQALPQQQLQLQQQQFERQQFQQFQQFQAPENINDVAALQPEWLSSGAQQRQNFKSTPMVGQTTFITATASIGLGDKYSGRKGQIRISSSAIAELENAFRKCQKPTRTEKKALSELIRIPYRNVQIW
ncbi:hypothetical protein HK100_002931 [Physocladia obscura]|uniref:Homeobox domain-containing protein n=1 Tax=Physocladia obscura TaxID=109957 RepID=A0AAD5TAQ9_9FUNG|nr:hypothetical protein HK100_002931 [Physocladia obscura]